jgi:hypothetical protein
VFSGRWVGFVVCWMTCLCLTKHTRESPCIGAFVDTAVHKHIKAAEQEAQVASHERAPLFATFQDFGGCYEE